MRYPLLLAGLAVLLASPCATYARLSPAVRAEEVVTEYLPAGNGAGPLWCYGSTVIARIGDDVYLSVIETGKDVPLLCNTRWQLWHRGPEGWKLLRTVS